MRLLWLALIACAIAAPSAQVPAPGGLDAAIASIDATIAADFAKDGVGGLSIGVVSGKELITTPARRQSHVALRAAPAPRL